MKKCFAFLLSIMLAMTITPISAANGSEIPNPPDPNDATTDPAYWAYGDWVADNAVQDYHPQAAERITPYSMMRSARGSLVGQAWATDGLGYYKQADYSSIIPGCSSSIASVGCALTATADVLNKWVERNLAQLASYLGTAGFDNSCNLQWGVVASRYGLTHQSKSFAPQYLEAEGLKAIRGQLEQGNAVIVKVHRVRHVAGLTDTHFIVCYGYETYLENGRYIYYHYITNPGSLPYGTVEDFMADWYIEAIHVYY